MPPAGRDPAAAQRDHGPRHVLRAVRRAVRAHRTVELWGAAALVAALFDGLDGGLARLLDASCRMGAELDSLADLVSFGVSPALVIYIWGLQGNRFGWIVALIFAVCMALRLARFNTLIDDEDQPPFEKEFFVGVPAPAAALVAGIPLYLWLHFGGRLVVRAPDRRACGRWPPPR